MRRLRSSLFGVGILLCAASPSEANPALTCRATKLTLAAKYGACRLGAESRAVRTGESPAFANCDELFAFKWQSAETKAGLGVCPSEFDEDRIGRRIVGHTDAIAALLSGYTLLECGNGMIEGDEQCEALDLNGQTCESLGYTIGGTLACTAGCAFDVSGCASQQAPASGQTTSYGAGSDGDVRAGAMLEYVDNGDGTISDLNTGLMWEKKVAFVNTVTGRVNCTTEAGTCANPHNANNAYTWSAVGNTYNGGAVTIFLDQLNNRCDADTATACASDADCAGPGGACGFGGYRDWRLPNVKELVSIVNYSVPYPGPTVSAALKGASCGPACTDVASAACSCTAPAFYWSSTSYANYPLYAWGVFFGNGYAGGDNETYFGLVRAVRGAF